MGMKKDRLEIQANIRDASRVAPLKLRLSPLLVVLFLLPFLGERNRDEIPFCRYNVRRNDKR